MRILNQARIMVWVFLSGLFISGCSGPSLEHGRVLIIGIDGAALDLAKPLMDQGRMPHLTQIAAEGASGPLCSLPPPLLSPIIWTTIATGKLPEKHGIHGWVMRNESGAVRLFDSTDRSGAAIWNIASDAGLTVGVVNWLVTFPPEVVRGILVSDHALPGEAKTRVRVGNRMARREFGSGLDEPKGGGIDTTPALYPPAWLETMKQAHQDDTRLTSIINPFSGISDLGHEAVEDALLSFFEHDQRVVRIALRVAAEVDPDLLMVLLPGIDRVSHCLWGTLHEEHSPQLSHTQRRAGAEALRLYYEYTDALIGRLLETVDEDDLVLVISDHGFEFLPDRAKPAWGGVHETVLAQNGIIFARGRGIPAGQPAGDISVADITPTILAWLGLPVAEDMDGRAASRLAPEPTTTLLSYDSIPIHRVGNSPSGAEAQILEQLRSLGYVD